ncbi:MAG: FAD-dependent monooxygenase, partial [Halobacteria archaeon]|nr:FAD-dependent monooxygenase [Halobacteria archaeon]
EPHNDSYTVIRGDFDRWLAEQAVEEGATLIRETTVTGLLRENDDREDRGAIRGVETDRPDGELEAPVVVLAEGANSLVSEQEKLKKKQERADVAVAAKEVLKFDRDVLENRFRLDEDAGVAFNYFGEGAVGDAVGGGFIYTNKRTLSVGVAYRMEDAASNQQSPHDVLDEFKSHPAVAPLVRDGRLVEYSAHAIPEGGYDAVPDVVHDGAVIAGDAAGLVLNNGAHLEGTNMAIESGYYAGKAVADAVEKGKTDAAALESYRANLENSFVMKNLEHYNWFHEVMADDREFLFEELPGALADFETEFFRVDGTPKEEHIEDAKESLLEATGGWIGAVRKAWKYRRMLS